MTPVPLVSVVIPTYNQPALLAETLDTVLAQTLTDYEVIVVDDGSTDATPERLRAHVDAFAGRLRVIRQDNRGVGAARNRGLDEARGKFIAPLDHDDLWMPEKLAAQAAFLEAHPECVTCTVPWAISDAPATWTFDPAAAARDDGVVRRPLRLMAAGQSLMITSSLMFDRARAAGLRYETPRHTVEDLAFQIDLLGRGEFGIAGEKVLMIYRRHSGNFSRAAVRLYNGHRMLRRFEVEGRFDRSAREDRDDVRAYLAAHCRFCAAWLLSAGERRLAAALYLRDLPHQLRLGRWKFLAVLPPLLLAPRQVVRRVWPGVPTGG